MYFIQVTHRWLCSVCGVASDPFITEPLLRRAMFDAGWIEAQFHHVDDDSLLDVEYGHYCPACKGKVSNDKSSSQHQGPGHPHQDSV